MYKVFILNGRKEDARKLLNKCDQGMLQSNMPYGMVSRGQQQNQISLQMALAAYIAEDTVLATKITNALQKDMEQQQAYYESLPVNKRDALSFEEERNAGLLNALHSLKQQFAAPVKAPAETTAPLTTQPVAPKPVDSPKK